MQMKSWAQGGVPKIGTILSIDHPAVVEIAKLSGFDWLWIDAEHGRFNELSAATACAITAGHVPTFVRVPDKSETTIKRYLDIGADGIILPQVSSLADARNIAQAALYPPNGQRSVGIARAHDYGLRFAEYVKDRSYSLIAQIENLAGISEVDRIVQEPYIDAIIVGPYDLSGSCGVPGDIACDQVQQGIAVVLAACKRAGKPCGIFAADAAAARIYIAQGFDLVSVGIDTMMLANAYKDLQRSM